jgi:hypothetical protein
LIRCNPKLFQRFDDNSSNSLTCVRAGELWEADREVVYDASSGSKVSNDTKEATLAAFCRLAIKAYVYFAYSCRQGYDYLRLQQRKQPHRVRCDTARASPQRAFRLWVGELDHIARRLPRDYFHWHVVVDEPEKKASRNCCTLK